jgi:hypothetical protein
MACRGCRSSRNTCWVYSRVMSLRAVVPCPLVGLGMLVACGTPNADRHQPSTEAQRVRVLNAVQRLRQDLNHSPCESILAGREQLRGAWIEQCDHIRETWGDWQSFGANYWYRSGPAIAVEGIAGFAKGNCTVQVIWALESPSPRMVAFFLASNEDQVAFPPLPPRFMDPPPTPSKSSPANA